jgi:hypothetical protein
MIIFLKFFYVWHVYYKNIKSQTIRQFNEFYFDKKYVASGRLVEETVRVQLNNGHM